LATTGKLYGRIIKKKNRITNIYNRKRIYYKILHRKREANNIETHLLFIDFERAYDAKSLQRLFKMLERNSKKIFHRWVPLEKCIKINVMLQN
jgi:hypothetical protein